MRSQVPNPLSVCALTTFLSLCFGAASAAEAVPGKQVAGKFTAKDGTDQQYLLFVPEKYDATKEAWPLMVFLHGSGERGDNLDLVKVHGPPKIVETKADFPFIVLSPQCAKDRRWNPDDLVAMIDDLASSLRVDKERIYLTGLSMGGYGTWTTAAKYPDRFAAIVPICGGGDPASAEKLKNIPCWVFHGAKDGAVPLAKSEEMVEAIKKAGGEPKFTIYPEAGHDSWTESYNNAELYTWLLKQSLSSPAK